MGAGADARAFASAEEGFKAIEEWRPDVLMSDIEMPGEDGYAFIRKVRSLDAASGGATSAVALTAYGRIADRQRTISAGFQHARPQTCRCYRTGDHPGQPCRAVSFARFIAVVRRPAATCTRALYAVLRSCRISPRQAPVSRPRTSMKSLKRWRSPSTRRLTTPSASPMFSTAPSGS